MARCRSIEGLMAASLYERLDAADQQTLDGHLERCVSCRGHYRALHKLVAVIPNEPVVFTGDLLPAVREELLRRPGRSRVFGWWGFAAATGAVVLLAGLTGYSLRAPELPLSPAYQTASVASPLVEALAQASGRIDTFDYHGAYQVLRKAVRDYPEDPFAGDAQLLVADLAFSQLYRYPEAYQAYETLRMKYNDRFTAASQNPERWALLAEAQQTNFASLEALEAARRAGASGFDQLEAVLARYPSQMVASLAAEEMAGLMADGIARDNGLPSDVLALEKARERCEDPVAIARLNLELAEVYARDLHDGAQACTLFKQVRESGDTTLAKLAEDMVARLGVDCGS